MNLLRRMLLVAIAISVMGTGDDAFCAANSVRSAVDAHSEILQEATASQARVDATHEQTQRLLEEYRAKARETEGLRRYNEYMIGMVRVQQASIAERRRQMEQVEATQREIVPLMQRMIQSLEDFIALDMPFRLEERRGRLQRLHALMADPDVSLAEKYRRIIQTFQAETEYGRTLDAYRDHLATAAGEQVVDVLRVGRLVLVYRSLDGAEAGVWNRRSGQWEPLDHDHRHALRQAFRVARKEQAPDLLRLPVPAPDVVP